MFQTSSEKIESAGLAALTALTSCLSRSVLNSDSEDSLSNFLDLILKGEIKVFILLEREKISKDVNELENYADCVKAVSERGS